MKGNRGETGTTLLEVLVASVIIVVFLAAVSACFGVTLRIWEITGPTNDLDSQAFRVVERLTGLLIRAGRGTVFPAATAPAGSSSISFQSAVGLSGAQAEWGAEQEFAWQLDPGEIEDGKDNDNDGLTDEGVVVWTVAPGTSEETTAILAWGVASRLEGETANGVDDNGNGLVDERGFSVVREGGLVTVRLTLMRAVRGGEHVTRTVSTTVRVRN